MTRGNHGQDVFQDDPDRRCFLETLEEACEKTGWGVHAYVLMSNHYHLLLETPEANLLAGMNWLQGAYPQRYNAATNCAVICSRAVTRRWWWMEQKSVTFRW
jgi:REP element-mobilizing transposase RayT